MAHLTVGDDVLTIDMSLVETICSFHGSFHIPLAHVTNAYGATWGDLELKIRLFGTGAGTIMTGGIFTTPEGVIFCDIHGKPDFLVIETHGERFARLAFTLDDGQEPNAVAHEICARLNRVR